MTSTESAVQIILQSVNQSPDSKLAIETGNDGVEVNLVESQLRFHHSFITGPLPVRAHQPAQAIIKACNNKQRSITKVLDLTAGWGVDSLTLACHGQQVTMLEQNELIYAIVAYSLGRLAAIPSGATLARRLSIENTGALGFLQGLDKHHEFDCIYLDPMFPAHKSSAKPAKEMQILQALTVNAEIDSSFELALSKARKRVVVKRPAKATRLGNLKPDLVYREKTIRLDIYLTA